MRQSGLMACHWEIVAHDGTRGWDLCGISGSAHNATGISRVFMVQEQLQNLLLRYISSCIIDGCFPEDEQETKRTWDLSREGKMDGGHSIIEWCLTDRNRRALWPAPGQPHPWINWMLTSLDTFQQHHANTSVSWWSLTGLPNLLNSQVIVARLVLALSPWSPMQYLYWQWEAICKQDT